MSQRGKVWLIGGIITLTVIAALCRDAESRELIVPATLVCLAISALVAEARSLRSLARSSSRPQPPAGARPADGIIEIFPIVGVEGEANPDLTCYQRFLGLLDVRADPTRVDNLSTTNPTLLGRVALISAFVGRDGSVWTDAEIARAHQALERAGRWIEREAIRFAAPVNIGLAGTYFQVQDDEVDPVEVAFSVEGDDVGPMEAHASTKAIVGASRAASTLGFNDVVDWFGRINARVDADVRIWLFHVRRAGRSLAIPASESEMSGVGLAVCFSREASFPEPLNGPGRVDPTTVVHELLHLLGATDKYGVALRSFPKRLVTSRDIMRLNHESLSRMSIDTLTAREIGWTSFAQRIAPGPTKNARRRLRESRRRAGYRPDRRFGQR